jgi:hypothetical protein
MRRHAHILFIALAVSCSTAPAPRHGALPALEAFFRRCEADLENAKRIIIERDMIKTLSHLQRMDGGGRKYYLLERESITAMILSVTEGVYSDFVLTDARGRVVYTGANDEIFARTVASMKEKALAPSLHLADGDDVRVTGPGEIAGGRGARYLAVSSPVSGGNTMPGTFTLLVDAERIGEVAGVDTAILDSRGYYIMTGKDGLINTPHPAFESIVIGSPGASDRGRVRGPDGRHAFYRIFRYRNLLWVLLGT